MAANGAKKTASPLPIIAILALLGGAYYASQTQLKSSRPEAPPGLRQAVSEKGMINARLWQDPLKVACEHEKTMHGTETSKDDIYVRKIRPTPWLNHERAMHCENKDEDKNYIRDSLPEHNLLDVTDRIRTITKAGLEPDDVGSTVHILMTMVRDGISAEDHERRLRNRYAMLTALHSSGLVPEDSMHIRYFRLPWIERNELDTIVRDKYEDIPKIGQDCNFSSESLIVPRDSKPIIIPYEWFEQEQVYLSGISGTKDKYVLLVWLPESAFAHRPLTRLAQIIDALVCSSNRNLEIDMIGPSHSGTLRTMLSEVEEINYSNDDYNDSNFVDVNGTLERLTIFSPWSTASPALLVQVGDWPDYDPNLNSKSEMYKVIPNQFKKVGVTFVRMIGSDDLLAMELINELMRRGVNVLRKDVGGKEHLVALISEWDTFYGNSFPMTFATMMESINLETGLPYNWSDYTSNLSLRMPSFVDYFPKNLHTYNYIRGIDGRLPESKSPEEEKSNVKTEDTSKLTFIESLELPAGRSQLDYIRRLTQKLKDKYKYFGNNKLKAIGVVGSDVYDKLILLQALREQFNDVIIFTIDIDARMLHHAQLKWTRNVIVASNYGLELNDKYQSKMFQHREGGLSPFRDNYQISLFLACRTALGLCAVDPDNNDPSRLSDEPKKPKPLREMEPEKLVKILFYPRLFEIGRGRAVDLSVSGQSEFKIHPPRIQRPDNKRLLIHGIMLLSSIMLCILLVALISPGAAEIVPLLSIRRWDRNSILIKFLVLAVIGFICFVIFDHYREGGEPFSLDAGVSIWPGEIFRLIAVILGASLLVRLVNNLKESEQKLCEEFSLEPLNSGTEQKQYTSWNWKRLKKYCGWLFVKDWIPKVKDVKDIVNAQELWNDYLNDSKWRYRFLRSVPMAFAFMILSFLAILIFGSPNTPFRGNISFIANNIILCLSGVYMAILIFFVLDATYLSFGLTKPLIKNPTKWPDKATKDLEVHKEVEATDFSELFDVRFVTKHTEDIGKMMYWPFIVLVVMVAARFPYFDDWNFPVSLILGYSVPSIYLILFAIKLQRTAKEVRSKALAHLNKKLFEARFGKNENRRRALKLRHLIREIESMREGAFRPFFENPVIHVIVGSGGAGLLALLKYMPLS